MTFPTYNKRGRFWQTFFFFPQKHYYYFFKETSMLSQAQAHTFLHVGVRPPPTTLCVPPHFYFPPKDVLQMEPRCASTVTAWHPVTTLRAWSFQVANGPRAGPARRWGAGSRAALFTP